jgi:hypothetical protein
VLRTERAIVEYKTPKRVPKNSPHPFGHPVIRSIILSLSIWSLVSILRTATVQSSTVQYSTVHRRLRSAFLSEEEMRERVSRPGMRRSASVTASPHSGSAGHAMDSLTRGSEHA